MGSSSVEDAEAIPRILVVTGTSDIHLPLFRSLVKKCRGPVVLLEAQQVESLTQKLARQAETGDCLAIPGNEISLNRLVAAISRLPEPLRRRIRVAGTCLMQGSISGPERLTDKEIATKLAAQAGLRSVRLVDGFEVDAPARSEWLRERLGTEAGAWAVKPATKDESDSFTRKYPGKVRLCHDLREIQCVLDDPEFAGRRFQIQRWIEGETISWAGSFDRGALLSGVEIRPLLKAPRGQPGGTTVLAVAEIPRPSIAEAAREMGVAMNLDGLFEIEFQVETASRVWFFGELNPRPWLQIPMILERDPDPLMDYLRVQGVVEEVAGRKGNPYPSRWGSVVRYIELNQKSLGIFDLVRILFCEIRLSHWYTWRERGSFLRRGLVPALAGRWRDVHWT